MIEKSSRTERLGKNLDVSRGPWKKNGALGIILCLAAVLAGWGNDYGLPHPTGRPDEENVVQHAFQMMASGNLARQR